MSLLPIRLAGTGHGGQQGLAASASQAILLPSSACPYRKGGKVLHDAIATTRFNGTAC
jgi:hypothetical protein